MANTPAVVDRLMQTLAPAGEVRGRPMFGGYTVYCDEKVVALICDDGLFVKITPAAAAYLDLSHAAPPYPGAKDHLRVPEERWDDAEWLVAFVRETAAALPAPKPRTRR